MSKRTPRGEQTSEAELAEVYYERRQEDSDWDEPETLETPARLDVTPSVRFTREELEAVRDAAERAGLRPYRSVKITSV